MSTAKRSDVATSHVGLENVADWMTTCKNSIQGIRGGGVGMDSRSSSVIPIRALAAQKICSAVLASSPIGETPVISYNPGRNVIILLPERCYFPERHALLTQSSACSRFALNGMCSTDRASAYSSGAGSSRTTRVPVAGKSGALTTRIFTTEGSLPGVTPTKCRVSPSMTIRVRRKLKFSAEECRSAISPRFHAT